MIYTLGHFDHPLDRFLQLLEEYGVRIMADVRSTPASGRFPWFSRDSLRSALKRAGIRNVYLGTEPGGRSQGDDLLVDGQVSCSKIQVSTSFSQGVQRLQGLAEAGRVCLVCAELEPLDCHRTISISPALVARRLSVVHILADGRLENHSETLRRLIAKTGLSENDLFWSQAEIEEEALLRQEKRIAWRPPPSLPDRSP